MKAQYQVVNAETRGDSCYEGKKGWYFHKLDPETMAIDTASVTGPFDTSAKASIEADKHSRAA